MPYRDVVEDPRVDAVRRTHIAEELKQIRGVVRKFTDEVEHAAEVLDESIAALGRARSGKGAGGFFARRPTVEDIEREEREVASRRTAHNNVTAALVLARTREVAVAELLESLPATATVTDPNVHALALAAGVRAATISGRSVVKHVRHTATLVIDAHRGEMLAALSSDDGNHFSTVPIAEHAVALARCHIELLRASILALGDHSPSAIAALGEVINTLEAAGTGPGQHWKDKVVAAAAQLDGIVDTLGRDR